MKARRTVIAVVGLLVAVAFSYYFSANHLSRRANPPNAHLFTLDAVCSGTAEAPFRYRVLVPWIIQALLPLSRAYLGDSSPWRLVFAIELVCTCLLWIALWLYLREWTERPDLRVLGMVLSASALMATYLVPTTTSSFYWFDIPAVLLFTVGLWAIRRGNWFLFYPLFAVATLNKETTCFLSLAFLLIWWKRRSFISTTGHLVAQGLLWLGVKVLLEFLANPGRRNPFFWFWLNVGRNVEALSSLYNWGLIVSGLGLLPVLAIMGWRRIGNTDARRLCWVGMPFLVSMFLVGYVEEIRIYGELIPVFLPASVLAFQTVTRHKVVGPPPCGAQ